LRLQENRALLNRENPSLQDVLGGASPDGAVVAQKQAPSGQMKRFDLAFACDIGLPIETLLMRYEARIARLDSAARMIFSIQDKLRGTLLERMVKRFLYGTSRHVTGVQKNGRQQIG
jgi:hypothetical protein